jgi:hypothetical protein
MDVIDPLVKYPKFPGIEAEIEGLLEGPVI